MAKAKRVRWECPEGLHPGVLGSTRPKRTALVRFCVPCSEAAGELVERVAPALERKGERAQAKTTERRQTAAQREASKWVLSVIEHDGDRGELDVRDTLRRLGKLRTLRDDAAGHMVTRSGRSVHLPEGGDLTLYRRRDAGASGSARPWSTLHLSIAHGCPREQVEELILHELAHYVLPQRAMHGPEFRAALVRACREWWPCDRVRAVRNEGEVYAMDSLLWRAAREAKREGEL